MIPDHLQSAADNTTSPARNCFAITPDNNQLFSYITKALYVGTGGDIVLRCVDAASDVTFVNVPDGSILDVRVVAVRATGTSAGDLVGLA